MSDEGTRLTDVRLTRRRFIQGSALAGFGAFLAACTGNASPSPTGGGVRAGKTVELR